MSTDSPWALTVVIAVRLDWRLALLFAAVAWMIRVETNRIAHAIWPQTYHAMRLVMDEHGFEFEGDYRKSV